MGVGAPCVSEIYVLVVRLTNGAPYLNELHIGFYFTRPLQTF